MLTTLLGGLFWSAICSSAERGKELQRRVALLAKRTKVPPEAQGPANPYAALRKLQLLTTIEASKSRHGLAS